MIAGIATYESYTEQLLCLWINYAPVYINNVESDIKNITPSDHWNNVTADHGRSPEIPTKEWEAG